MNLILMGLRGSGKSTAGRLVAARSGSPFIDLDDATARRLGAATVREAWDRVGQAAFREAEAAALAEHIAADSVLSLGGGTPTAPGAAALLRTSGRRIVYLRAPAQALRSRLAATDLASRPTITGADPLAEVDRLWAERDPLYRALATHVLEVGELSVEQTMEKILALAKA